MSRSFVPEELAEKHITDPQEFMQRLFKPYKVKNRNTQQRNYERIDRRRCWSISRQEADSCPPIVISGPCKIEKWHIDFG
jgi:hypothetical protein